MQKHVNLLDLVKSFPKVIHYFSLFHYYYTVTVQIQNLVSLQPRISLEEFSKNRWNLGIWTSENSYSNSHILRNKNLNCEASVRPCLPLASRRRTGARIGSGSRPRARHPSPPAAARRRIGARIRPGPRPRARHPCPNRTRVGGVSYSASDPNQSPRVGGLHEPLWIPKKGPPTWSTPAYDPKQSPRVGVVPTSSHSTMSMY